MERMAADSADMACHTPSDSKICREPLPSAVVRSSKLGCTAESGGMLSMSSTRNFVARRASAKLAPTMPPPTIATSYSFIDRLSCNRRHQPLDLDRVLGHAVGEHLTTVARHHDIVFDANADSLVFLRRARRAGSNVDAGLDGQRHAGLEHAPLVADLVVADVMHIHAEPMPGAVHEEFSIGARLFELGELALEQSELEQSLRDDAHRHFMRCIPMIAGLHGCDGGVIRLEHDVI